MLSTAFAVEYCIDATGISVCGMISWQLHNGKQMRCLKLFSYIILHVPTVNMRTIGFQADGKTNIRVQIRADNQWIDRICVTVIIPVLQSSFHSSNALKNLKYISTIVTWTYTNTPAYKILNVHFIEQLYKFLRLFYSNSRNKI